MKNFKLAIQYVEQQKWPIIHNSLLLITFFISFLPIFLPMLLPTMPVIVTVILPLLLSIFFLTLNLAVLLKSPAPLSKKVKLSSIEIEMKPLQAKKQKSNLKPSSSRGFKPVFTPVDDSQERLKEIKNGFLKLR